MKLVFSVFIFFLFITYIHSSELALFEKSTIKEGFCQTESYCCGCICQSGTGENYTFAGFVGASACSSCNTLCASKYQVCQNANNAQEDICISTSFTTDIDAFPMALCIIVSLAFVGILAFFMFKIRKHERKIDRSFASKAIEFTSVMVSLIVIIGAILFWVGTGHQKSILDQLTTQITGFGNLFNWFYVPMWVVPVYLCINCLALIISVFNEVFEYSIFGRCCMVCCIPFGQFIFTAPLIIPFLINAISSTVYTTGVCSVQNVGGFTTLCLDFTYYSTLAMLGSGIIIFMTVVVIIVSCAANCIIQSPHKGYQQVQHHVHHHHKDQVTVIPPQNYPPQNYPPQNYPPQNFPPQNYGHQYQNPPPNQNYQLNQMPPPQYNSQN
eukprot:TRINITY_DN5177_c0_g1_i2.p1 TRINITY_DN5177_c0_g1~~TRINITY_DN5177_c0_g1_i2.p1  ORF type:complete len:383 (+),score=85.72 TRINITY_DN5177_c0_g1_i2:1-1149(+)